MKTWTPLTEGRLNPARLREPGAWACPLCGDDGFTHDATGEQIPCPRCNTIADQRHTTALVECDLWGIRAEDRGPSGGIYEPWLLSNEIAAVFGLFATTPQIEWIVPTRVPEAMREWFIATEEGAKTANWTVHDAITTALIHGQGVVLSGATTDRECRWPLINVTPALTVTTQADLDAGIADLLACPATKRAVLVDGATERVDFLDLIASTWQCIDCGSATTVPPGDAQVFEFCDADTVKQGAPQIAAIYHRNCAPEVVADLEAQYRAAGAACVRIA